MDTKRQPLSVMIALQSKKLKGGDAAPGKDEPDGDEGDARPEAPDEEVQACQDVIDAMKNRDPKALGEALHNWMEIAGYDKAKE